MSRAALRRVAWVTDIHLDHLITSQIDAFIAAIQAKTPDVLLITGDIAVSQTTHALLEFFAKTLNIPIYFILGNHDYWGSDIDPVRLTIADLMQRNDDLYWLSGMDVAEITPQVGLVGHDAWSDGRYGDFLSSEVMLNDYLRIASLTNLSDQKRLERLNQLGDEAGEHLRRVLPTALSKYQQVLVLLHPPPFPEACWYDEKPARANDKYLPHFTCKAAGDALLEMADAYPQRELLVLCGHTHGGGHAQMRPNLRVLTGDAKYGEPEIQRVFKFPV